MTEIAERIQGHVDEFIAGLAAETLEPPEVFRDRDQQATPSLLQEWARFVASQREFVAEGLQEARRTLDVVDAMMKVTEGDHEDKLNEKLAEDAATLINRGFAAQERMAHAKLSLVEDRVDLRGAIMQRDRLASTVQQLEHCHREWRAAEFTIDRMVRLTQLRLQLSEL